MSDPQLPDNQEGEERYDEASAARRRLRRELIRERSEVTVRYEAPLPPPSMMEHYERIQAGSADRIIAMAERQSLHRQTLESKVIQSKGENERLGQIFGFILAAIGLSGGIYLAHEGQMTAGLTIFLAILASLVTVFVTGRKGQIKERQEKVEQLKSLLLKSTDRPKESDKYLPE